MLLPLSIETRKPLAAPTAVIGIITANVCMHAFLTACEAFQWIDPPTLRRVFAFSPAHFSAPGFILSMFTHANWFHLASNMFFLWVFGWILENQVGWKKFLLLYLGCGVAGSLWETLIYWGSVAAQTSPGEYYAIGASGAVMAVAGVCVMRFYNLKVRIVNPLVAPVIIWFILMVFMPAWRDWLAVSFLILFPFFYILPFTVKKMVWRMPLWVMTLYYFAGDYASILYAAEDNINHIAHAFSFLSGAAAGWLMYLPQENLDEMLLDRAREDAREGIVNAASSEYGDYLLKHPSDADVRVELADFYLQREEKSRFNREEYRQKSLFHYQKSMELWIKQDRMGDTVKLFRSLRGTFRDEEFKPPLVAAIQKAGENDKALSLKAVDRRATLEEEIRRLHAERLYPAAHAALQEWWKLGDLAQSDTAFLALAGELCHLAQDAAKEERIYQSLVERGNTAQASRALPALAKRWMGTPGQMQLAVLFKNALARLPELALNHEITELQERLKREIPGKSSKEQESARPIRWGMEYYLREGRPQAAGSAPAAAPEAKDPAAPAQTLEGEFNAFEGTGKYQQAHEALEKILKFKLVHELEASFLARAGEVCLRTRDQGMAERIFECVARRGDVRQTVRALEVLSRYWLKTERHSDLARLYKDSGTRFPDIGVFPEWVELGEKLKG